MQHSHHAGTKNIITDKIEKKKENKTDNYEEKTKNPTGKTLIYFFFSVSFSFSTPTYHMEAKEESHIHSTVESQKKERRKKNPTMKRDMWRGKWMRGTREGKIVHNATWQTEMQRRWATTNILRRRTPGRATIQTKPHTQTSKSWENSPPTIPTAESPSDTIAVPVPIARSYLASQCVLSMDEIQRACSPTESIHTHTHTHTIHTLHTLHTTHTNTQSIHAHI